MFPLFAGTLKIVRNSWTVRFWWKYGSNILCEQRISTLGVYFFPPSRSCFGKCHRTYLPRTRTWLLYYLTMRMKTEEPSIFLSRYAVPDNYDNGDSAQNLPEEFLIQVSHSGNNRDIRTTQHQPRKDLQIYNQKKETGRYCYIGSISPTIV